MGVFVLAARVGFEPTDGGFRVHCLTTWLPGNKLQHANYIIQKVFFQ